MRRIQSFHRLQDRYDRMAARRQERLHSWRSAAARRIQRWLAPLTYVSRHMQRHRVSLYDLVLRLRKKSPSRPRRPRWGDRFLGIWRQATGPWRWIGNPLARMGDRLQARIDALPAATARHTTALERRLGISRWAARWLDPVRVALWHYGQTRRWRHLLWGLPALVVLLAMLGVGLLMMGSGPAPGQTSALLRRADRALQLRQFDPARVAYERLIQLGQDDPSVRFGLFQCLDAQGDVARAKELLNALAPDSAAGYIPAHRARALQLLRQPTVDLDDRRRAEFHLRRVLALDPNDAEAHGLLADLLFRRNQVAEARDHYVQAAQTKPELALPAALLSRQLQDEPTVSRLAPQAAAYFRSLIRGTSGPVPVDVYLALSRALALEGRFADACAALEEGLPRSDRHRLEQAILSLCQDWGKYLDAQAPSDTLTRLQVLTTALRYDPKNPIWQLPLVALAGGDAMNRPAVLRQLEQLAQQGDACAESDLFLGNEARKQGDLAAARRYFEAAYTLKPDFSPIIYALTRSLLEGAQQDPARALTLATQALAATPQSAVFHELRGYALIALDRWTEAAAELEGAIAGLPDPAAAHRALVVVYEKLGRSTDAETHRRLARTAGGVR